MSRDISTVGASGALRKRPLTALAIFSISKNKITSVKFAWKRSKMPASDDVMEMQRERVVVGFGRYYIIGVYSYQVICAEKILDGTKMPIKMKQMKVRF